MKTELFTIFSTRKRMSAEACRTASLKDVNSHPWRPVIMLISVMLAFGAWTACSDESVEAPTEWTSKPTASQPSSGSNPVDKPNRCGCPAPPTGTPSVLVADDTEDTTRALINALLKLAPPELDGRRASDVFDLVRPGKGHKQMHAILGVWDAPSKYWAAPGVEPVISPGYSIRKMIMGGRFVYEDYEGYFFGKPFRGLGITAFDNATGTFPAMWIDTLGTNIMTSTGTVDETGKVFEFRGEYFDSLSGRMRKTHSWIRVLGEDSYVLSLNFVQDDGSEYQVFQVDYSRRR